MGRMKLMQAITSPTWIPGFKVEVSRCENCHRSMALRNLSARKAGIRMHGLWYCSSSCFTSAVESELASQLRSRMKLPHHFSRMPLGLSLVSRGLLTNVQLREALDEQKKSGGDIGDVLVRRGSLSEEQMTAARAALWNCPVFAAPSHLCGGEINVPSSFLHLYSAIPLHYVPATKTLLIGFVHRVEYGLLYVIERITGCQTRACFVTPSDFYSQMRRREESQGKSGNQAGKQMSFDDAKTSREMAHVLCEYAVDFEAEEAILAGCKEHVWARLKCSDRDIDLLFRAS